MGISLNAGNLPENKYFKREITSFFHAGFIFKISFIVRKKLLKASAVFTGFFFFKFITGEGTRFGKCSLSVYFWCVAYCFCFIT